MDNGTWIAENQRHRRDTSDSIQSCIPLIQEMLNDFVALQYYSMFLTRAMELLYHHWCSDNCQLEYRTITHTLRLFCIAFLALLRALFWHSSSTSIIYLLRLLDFSLSKQHTTPFLSPTYTTTNTYSSSSLPKQQQQ